MPQRLSGLALGCAALLAALVGCTTPDTNDASNTPAGSTASTAPAASPTAAKDPCPPDAAALLAALKATPAIMDKIAPPSGLEQPVCSQGWTIAKTKVTGADPAFVLFRLEPVSGKWIPVAAGTDQICDALSVPADIQSKLGPTC